MELPFLDGMEKEVDYINFLILKISLLITMKEFILLIVAIIVLFHVKLMKQIVKSLQGEMVKEIEWAS